LYSSKEQTPNLRMRQFFWEQYCSGVFDDDVFEYHNLWNLYSDKTG
jgi:hypothetical protein